MCCPFPSTPPPLALITLFSRHIQAVDIAIAHPSASMWHARWLQIRVQGGSVHLPDSQRRKASSVSGCLLIFSTHAFLFTCRVDINGRQRCTSKPALGYHLDKWKAIMHFEASNGSPFVWINALRICLYTLLQYTTPVVHSSTWSTLITN